MGPGAGLSLLGALWALIAAIGIAIAFVVAWPIRKMLRKKKTAQPQVQQRRQTDRPDGADRAEPTAAQRTGNV